LYYTATGNADAASKFAPGLEYLLYDYDLHVGDTLHWKPGWQRVVKIDSVFANGSYLRRFHFNEITSMDYSMDHWVEGPGSMLGFFGALDKPESSVAGPGMESHTYTATYCGPKYHYSFIIGNLASAVYDSVNCSLKPLSVSSTNPVVSELQLFPNPGSGEEIHIESPGGMTDVKVFDLHGRMVAHREPAMAATAVTISLKLPPAVYVIMVTLPDRRVLVQRYQRL
jgi:hypothetical protein